ncbi:MAG: chromate transporter [Firmicutes bacterium]|nr:chromate transporter [Bacillota bacterium]
MIYLQLYLRFFMTGLFAVGGGLATIPFLQEMAETTGWFTAAELADMIAVSECTPGAMGVNMATYVGYTTAGVLGDIIATMGLITPSIIIILIVAKILDKFRTNKYVQWAFYGLRAASVALISVATLAVAEMALLKGDISALAGGAGAGSSIAGIFGLLDFKCIFLAVLIFMGMRKFKKIHPSVFIGISALAGIIFSLGGV